MVPNIQIPGTPEFNQEIRDCFALAAQPGFFNSQTPVTVEPAAPQSTSTSYVPAALETQVNSSLPSAPETPRTYKRLRPAGRHYYY